MSVFYKIPHSSLYHPTTNIFVANFNVPSLGKYDFDIPANKNVNVLELQNNCYYLIERISLAGSVSQETYLSSIETVPFLRLKKRKSGEVVYKRDIPLVNYIDNQEIVCWVESKKAGDYLTADVFGLLEQVPETVGETQIRLNINFSIYQIKDLRVLNQLLGEIKNTTEL